MADQSDDQSRTAQTEVGIALHHRGYLALLTIAALIGIPLSAIAFGFLAAVHELEHLMWESIPHDLGYDHAPAWWAILLLTVAGVIVGLVVAHFPGHGGHVPVEGISAGPTPIAHLPGIVLAAAGSLILGAVVGPEAPLMAIGSGLAVYAIRRTDQAGDATVEGLLAATGAAAALSSIFGNPLVAAVMLLEALGLARRQTMLVMLPALVSSGIGALIFTGLGDWTGLGIGALALPDLDVPTMEPINLLLVLPVSAGIAVVTWLIYAGGHRVAARAAQRPLSTTIAAGVLAGCCAGLYTVLTDHSPAEVAMSGQATLAQLGADPRNWTATALLLLVVLKGLAYAVCIGTFRGGPVFPALFLGGAMGVLVSMWIPGVDSVAGLAIGMAAGIAVTRLVVTSILLVVLLLGDASTHLMPIIILGAVTALIIEELLTSWQTSRLTPEG